MICWWVHYLLSHKIFCQVCIIIKSLKSMSRDWWRLVCLKNNGSKNWTNQCICWAGSWTWIGIFSDGIKIKIADNENFSRDRRGFKKKSLGWGGNWSIKRNWWRNSSTILFSKSLTKGIKLMWFLSEDEIVLNKRSMFNHRSFLSWDSPAPRILCGFH